MDKLRIGVSACLLGQEVRYDGQHKLDHYITETLGQVAEFIPVCPEVECGLPIPREAMHLAGPIENPRLVTIRTGVDLTAKMNKWLEKKLPELAEAQLDGFIFKSKSPSSGRYAVKVFGNDGIPVKKGVGLFARAVVEHFPWLPVEEEGRLNDLPLRENFIDKIIVYHRWRKYSENDGSRRGLVDFHSRHKYLLMAHSPAGLNICGRIVADGKNSSAAAQQTQYLTALMQALDTKATLKKNRNVMLHIMGYFKKDLSAFEKEELLALISGYAEGVLPALAPLTLLRHYAGKFQSDFLLQQHYLSPAINELRLKYHT